MDLDLETQGELPKGREMGVAFGGRVPVGGVWEIPHLQLEPVLRSAERLLVGHKAQGPASPTSCLVAALLAGPWLASASRALGPNAKEPIPVVGELAVRATLPSGLYLTLAVVLPVAFSKSCLGKGDEAGAALL